MKPEVDDKGIIGMSNISTDLVKGDKTLHVGHLELSIGIEMSIPY